MFYGCTSLQLLDIRQLTLSNLTTTPSNMMTSVPNSVKIIVKDETEKSWWESKFSNYKNLYTPEEAIAAGIIEE